MSQVSTEMHPLAAGIASLFFSLEEIYEEASKRAGLSPQQAQLLCATDWKRPALGELADTMRCDKTNVTGLVDRAERLGLVQRVPDSEDRRVIRLELTGKGKESVAEFHAELNRRVERIEHNVSLSADDLFALAEQIRQSSPAD